MRQKVSCILCHRGIQLRLAYSWARPAILAAGKDSGVMFLLCPGHFQWSGEGLHIVSLFVCTSIPSARNKNGFCSVSFEKISVLDSNFIHRYIIINYRSSSI